MCFFSGPVYCCTNRDRAGLYFPNNRTDTKNSKMVHFACRSVIKASNCLRVLFKSQPEQPGLALNRGTGMSNSL